MRHTITERTKEHHDSESLDALRSVSALAGCAEADLRRIDGLGTEVRRAAGTVLQRPGSLLRQAFVVIDGVVTEQPVVGRESVAGPGHGVGFEAMGHTAHASSKVVALTDVRVLVFGALELADMTDIAATSHHAEPSLTPLRRRSHRRTPVSQWLPSQSAIA